jgi:hypothetical protein
MLRVHHWNEGKQRTLILFCNASVVSLFPGCSSFSGKSSTASAGAAVDVRLPGMVAMRGRRNDKRRIEKVDGVQKSDAFNRVARAHVLLKSRDQNT